MDKCVKRERCRHCFDCERDFYPTPNYLCFDSMNINYDELKSVALKNTTKYKNNNKKENNNGN